MHLVLFDIDGTLLKSNGCGRAATKIAVADMFGTIGVLDDIDFAGKTDWQILNEALVPAGITVAEIQTNMVPYNQMVAQRLGEIISDYAVTPCPGALDVIAALRQNPAVVVGLVTGNMAGLVPLKLARAGFDPADFKVAAYGSEGWERTMLPPLALRRARAYAGIDFPGDRIVIIGDTPNDILCAASVKGRTLAVATGPFKTQELRLHQPTYAFDDMSDVDGILAVILADEQQKS